jgi:uncharacterized membrane protein YkoI
MKCMTIIVAVGVFAVAGASMAAQAPRATPSTTTGRTGSGQTAPPATKTSGTSAALQTKISKLPPAVRATVEAESKSATVQGISSEKEKGKTVYELETLVNGRTRDLMIDATGKVYIVEEQLDADKAPAPVRSAMEAQGKIVALESVLKDGKTTYEGQVQTKTGKKVAVEVDAAGKPVKS